MKILFVAALVLLPLRQVSADQSDNLPAVRFAEVVKGKIYRGGEPPLWQILDLAKTYGIKTIIDLDNDSKAIKKEKQLAEANGMKFISVPLNPVLYPKDGDMSKIYKLLTDKKQYPIYIHCWQGKDRTGLAIGLYRVFKQNWLSEQAYSEMLKFGFVTYNLGLKSYFEDKTAGHSAGDY